MSLHNVLQSLALFIVHTFNFPHEGLSEWQMTKPNMPVNWICDLGFASKPDHDYNRELRQFCRY